MKTLTLLMVIIPMMSFSQLSKSEVENLLTNGNYRQWKVIGTTSHLGTKKCTVGDAFYTFQKDKVLVKTCHHLSWESETLSFSVGEKEGEAVVYIDGKLYYFKVLPTTAEACKDSDNCIRLSLYSKTMDQYTQDFYLTY